MFYVLILKEKKKIYLTRKSDASLSFQNENITDMPVPSSRLQTVSLVEYG